MKKTKSCLIHQGVALLLAMVMRAGGEAALPEPPALSEHDQGLAAKYPGDAGIGRDPAVIFHDDFEAGTPKQKWDNVYHDANLRIVSGPGEIHGGRQALELTVPKQKAEVSNELVKQIKDGRDVVFLRHYSKFDKDFNQTGSSHNGVLLAAISPGLSFATPGIRADGRNKFMASYENWRAKAAEPSPGELNVYCYHPEQRSEYGDHFFPSGKVLPWSRVPGAFGRNFKARPDIVPELARWYCFELMLKANTAGQRDGRIACWLDGKLVADFPNLRLRDDNTLKINYASLGLHIRSNPVRENKKWYDDVVMASSYIGPVFEKGAKAGTDSSPAAALPAERRIW